MPLPTTWPPRPPSGRRSIRFYKTGALTANFADNAWIFADAANLANTYTPLPVVAPGSNTVVNIGATPTGTGQTGTDPAPMIWANAIRISVTGGDIEFSFDGTNIHGKVLSAQSTAIYRERLEAGIAVRGTGTFYVEAW